MDLPKKSKTPNEYTALTQTSFLVKLWSIFRKLRNHFESSSKDAKRHCCLFIVGVSAITVSFICSMISQAILIEAPQILYKDAIYKQGDIDLILTKISDNTNRDENAWPLLNVTAITDALADVYPNSATGRITSLANISTRNLTKYEFTNYKHVKHAFCPMVFVNPQKEQQLGIANGILANLTDDGVIVSQSWIKKNNLKLGDVIWVRVN